MLINRRTMSLPVTAVALAGAFAVSLVLAAVAAVEQLATIALVETSAVAVIGAFALLIWAAIQDGKPGDFAPATD